MNNIIENGGWHFCNLKSPEKLLYKYKNLCETNDPYHFKEKINPKYLDINEIKSKIQNLEDIIGRDDKFEKIQINNDYPKYILENKKKFNNWII